MMDAIKPEELEKLMNHLWQMSEEWEAERDSVDPKTSTWSEAMEGLVLINMPSIKPVVCL